jgi:hypothetical protein
MFVWFASLPWLSITPVALLGTTVLMVLRGSLLPRSVLDGARHDWETRLAERGRECDDWKHAFLNSEAARTQTDEQLGLLLELYRSTDQYIRSRTSRSGDHD